MSGLPSVTADQHQTDKRLTSEGRIRSQQVCAAAKAEPAERGSSSLLFFSHPPPSLLLPLTTAREHAAAGLAPHLQGPWSDTFRAESAPHRK